MVHTSYRAVDAVRRARYFRPEAERPVRKKDDRDRYRRPPPAKPRRRRR